MLDLSLVTKPLTPTENPGLDTLDPRFQEIATLVEAGEFQKAAEQTQALLQEGIVDIRVISYFLYGVFVEQQIPALPELLKAIVTIAGPNWAAVGPVAKKEKHTEAGLSWFLTRVHKRLVSTEEAKGDDWNKWTETITSDQTQAILDGAGSLRSALGPINLPSTRVVDALKPFEEWFKGFQKVVAAAKPAAPAEAPPAEEAKPADAGAAAPAAAPAGSGAPNRVQVEGSIYLVELQQKLQAFEALCKKEDFNKASIIAADVAAIVEKFDPRLYFPRLFAGFYNLSAKNVEKIVPVLETKETPQWKALEALYRVDLEAFVE
jgi:hypothetical protein